MTTLPADYARGLIMAVKSFIVLAPKLTIIIIICQFFVIT